jgi:simple sugar transport system permease protein
LVSIGLTISFIAKFWNIGGEGQLLIGEVAAFWVYIQFVDVAAYKAMDIPSADKVFFGDTTSTLIMMVIAAFFAGGVWALIPAILKSRWGVNEILTTIMMNYVVLSAILPALIYGPWREPKYLFGRSIEVPTYMRLDALRYVPEQGYTLNPVYLGMLCLIVAAAIVMTFVLYRTKIGYEVRVVGDNPKVAKTAGIRVGLVYSLGMFISGGLAGMAGVAFLLINGFMDPLLSPGYGYTGIVAAWLGNLHPATTLLAAIFISYLSVLGDIMEGPRIKLPKALTTAVVATILLGLVMFEIFRRYRVRIIRIPSRR